MGQVRTRRVTGKGPMPARSVRVSDEVWNRGRSRAEYEGTTISNVAALLIEGYAKGLLDLPRVEVVYTQPKSE